MDRAARLADEGQITDVRSARWHDEAEHIRTWVDANCWSEAKSSYTFFAGTEDLDAAVLLAARTGFDRGDRLATTIAAIQDELGAGPLLYRYTGANLEEGAFVACTFWMVEALALTGQCDEATELMHQAVGLVNDVGLLSEEIDVGSLPSSETSPKGCLIWPSSTLRLPFSAVFEREDQKPGEASARHDTQPRDRRLARSRAIDPAPRRFRIARVSWGCFLLVLPSGLMRAVGLSSDSRVMDDDACAWAPTSRPGGGRRGQGPARPGRRLGGFAPRSLDVAVSVHRYTEKESGAP